jgi:hypothetical protein
MTQIFDQLSYVVGSLLVATVPLFLAANSRRVISALEQLPAYLLPGSSLEVDHERYRYNVEEIRQLYDSEEYPLKRRAGL